ncbi:MAG: anthranilate phosphoribosyltransferase [Candidatus Saganbacteria bacterium]|nr:anthranilate phosphoribosyltransferase [Candidatus Saganbacteria bacterium]
MIREYIKALVDGKDLTKDDSSRVMEEIMTGKTTSCQIASLITALRIKGETAEEISGFAKVMRQHAVPLKLKTRYFVDTCGTGGDVSGTFNISTVSAFIASGAGVVVAKHGNRAVSSRCGSADLLEALGIKINIAPEQVRDCIDEVGIGFIFAPVFHEAMKFAAPARKEIGIRTVFNILGPVSNPANTKGQLMGVYAAGLTTVMAQVLKDQGCETAMVVHGMDGIDEISLSDRTKVAYLEGGVIKEYYIEPESLGLKKCRMSDVSGGEAGNNAKTAIAVLSGKEKGPKHDIAVLNAAAAIVVGRKAADLSEGIKKAEQAIRSGEALKKLEELKKFTNKQS